MAVLRYGERVCVTGKLAHITPRMIAGLVGDSGENVTGGGDGAALRRSAEP